MEYENAGLFQRINGGICILTKWNNNETENVGDRDLSWQQEREGRWWWEVDKAMTKNGNGIHRNSALLDKWTLLFLSTFRFHFSQAMVQSHVIICPKKDLFGIEVELEKLKIGGELLCHMQMTSLLSNIILVLNLPHHTCSSCSSSSSDTNLSLSLPMLLMMMMMVMFVEIFQTELVLLIKQQQRLKQQKMLFSKVVCA